MPEPEERYAITVRDSNGTEMSKTAAGKKLGRPVKTDANYNDKPDRGPKAWKPAFLFPHTPKEVAIFDLFDNFKIEHSGEYRINVEVRLYSYGPGGKLTPFTLPQIDAPIQVEGLGPAKRSSP